MSRARLVAISIACSICVALAAPGAAPADHGPVFSDPAVDRYLGIAERQWGAPAPTCSGPAGEVIPVHAVLFQDPDPDVVGAAELPGCRIWLDRDHWPRPLSVEGCVVIVHEWGHLLGHGHSNESDNVMFSSPIAGAPACRLVAPPRPSISIGSAVRARSRYSSRRARRAHRRRATRSRSAGRPVASIGGRSYRRRGRGRVAIDRR